MPRTARQISESGVYHVFLRGIDRQVIFIDDDDFNKFKANIAQAKNAGAFELYAYCLMDNHVHLLVKVGDNEIGQVVQRIATGYAGWFNWKYDRVGHLFQGRFGSETIKDDSHLIAAIRYIHLNPVKAGISKQPELYKWSSLNDYLSGAKGLVDTAFIIEMAEYDPEELMNLVVGNQEEIGGEGFIDDDATPRLTDELLRAKIRETWGVVKTTDLGLFEEQLRDQAIHDLKAEGFGLRQIARVAGIPLGIVRKR